MEIFIVTVLTLIVLSLGLFLAKGTILSVTGGYQSVWALLYYKEIFLIFIPVFLLAFFPASHFSSLKMVDQSLVFEISLGVICSFSLYFLIYIFFLRTFFGNGRFDLIKSDLVDCFNQKKIFVFSVASLFSGGCIFLFSIFFLGYKHALLTSIVTGENILHIRLHNAYYSTLPSQLSYIVTFSYWIAAIFSAYLFFLKKRFSSGVVFLIGLLLATSGGAKAPLIIYVMLFVMACLYIFRPKISSFKFYFFSPLYFISILLLIYFVVSRQIPDLDFKSFLLYLLERLGVGQIAGTYETFSIGFRLPESSWHMVPFASFFIDYPIFSKELMLFTEGREYTATGVKNSFFIAEAYGMGGFYLAIISPIVMAIAYFVKGGVLFYLMSILFGRIVAKLYFIPIFFLSTNLTGDFSSMALQKGTILLIIVLGLVYLVGILFRLLFTCRLPPLSG